MPMTKTGSFESWLSNRNKKTLVHFRISYLGKEGKICMWRFPADVLLGKNAFYHLRQFYFHFE